MYSTGLGRPIGGERTCADHRRRLIIPLGAVDQTSSGKRSKIADDTGSIHALVAHLAGDAASTAVAFLLAPISCWVGGA